MLADRLVRFLEPNEVVVMDVGDNGMVAPMGRSTRSQEWLKEYTFDEVWRLGLMEAASVKIAIIVEGETERAFMPLLRAFLRARLAGPMPKMVAVTQKGRIPKGDALKRLVEELLTFGREPYDAVIALTDVYTGTKDFVDAADAKAKMRGWVGPNPSSIPMPRNTISKPGCSHSGMRSSDWRSPIGPLQGHSLNRSIMAILPPIGSTRSS